MAFLIRSSYPIFSDIGTRERSYQSTLTPKTNGPKPYSIISFLVIIIKIDGIDFLYEKLFHSDFTFLIFDIPSSLNLLLHLNA